MKVGVCEATELKKRSEMLSIPFADLLWGYAVEDLMLRVSTSAYREFLWLMSLPLLGEEAYRQRAKKRIRFFYKGSEEELTPDKLQPGQRLSIAMGEHIKTTLFAKENAQKIHWEGTVTALSGGIRLSMTAGYFDMKVPLNIEIYRPLPAHGYADTFPSACAYMCKPGIRPAALISALFASSEMQR